MKFRGQIVPGTRRDYCVLSSVFAFPLVVAFGVAFLPFVVVFLGLAMLMPSFWFYCYLLMQTLYVVPPIYQRHYRIFVPDIRALSAVH